MTAVTADVCVCRDCRACDPDCPDPECQAAVEEASKPGGRLQPLGPLPTLGESLARRATR
jgi:hypothetical protein